MTEPINFSAKNKNVLRINKINENEKTGDTERMFNFIFLVIICSSMPQASTSIEC